MGSRNQKSTGRQGSISMEELKRLRRKSEKLRRQGLGKGGRVCKIAIKGQNREAIGKNS